MTKSSEMNYCVLDVETTIKNNGHPFTKENKLCAVGIKDKDGTTVYRIEHGMDPYGTALAEIRERVERADYLVGFNIKFDLHWIRRYVPSIRFPVVFDCQLADFLLNHQTVPFPSLDAVCASHSLACKSDVVRRDYWDLGIDTVDVPWDVLSEYCATDVEITDALHLKQKELFDGTRKKLFYLQCIDLMVLEEMEWNGLKYDFETARAIGQKLQKEAETIDAELRFLVGHPCVNLASSDHMSSVLYGGVVWERYREHYTRTLKDGTIKPCERWSLRPVVFDRMVAPLRGTELKPTAGLSDEELGRLNRRRVEEGRNPFDRKYSVAEPVLNKLRPNRKARRIIELILRKSRISKLDSTYYSGLADKADSMGWSDGYIHGQFNQCSPVTGRLSSSEPNEQNFDNDIKILFGSRFGDRRT